MVNCVCFQKPANRMSGDDSVGNIQHTVVAISLSDLPGGCRRSAVGTVHPWGKFRTAAEWMSAAYKWASS